VARAKLNLYEELPAADGVTSTLRLVDTTTTSSWDDWAQGFGGGAGLLAFQHELPGPGSNQPILPDLAGQHAVAQPRRAIAAQRAVQVL